MMDRRRFWAVRCLSSLFLLAATLHLPQNQLFADTKPEVIGYWSGAVTDQSANIRVARLWDRIPFSLLHPSHEIWCY